MNNIKEFLYNYRNVIIFLLVIISFVLLVVFYKEDNTSLEEVITTNEEVKKEERNIEESIFVDIKGAVKSPGVYEMKKGSRVIDVMKKSGIKKSANTKYINLSKKLEDEMVIIIYTNSEVKKYLQNKNSKSICSVMVNNACIKDNTKTINSVSDGTTTNTISANLDTSKNNDETSTIAEESGKDLININTAGMDKLITLPGIGESKANSIISYRKENGLFSSIVDITNVSGIGKSIYEKIKDNITV